MEIALAFFIFLTWIIDTFSILLKGSLLTRRYPSVFVVSQAFLYVTRFSIFFIMPIIGAILDEVVEFDTIEFYIGLIFFLLAHSVVYICCYGSIEARSRQLTYYFVENLKKFLVLTIMLPIKLRWSVTKYEGLNFGYMISHISLMFTFPVLLYVGEYFPEYRASIMGAVALYTGLFSLYIVFFIERRFVSVSGQERRLFANQLVVSKCISSFLCALIVGVVVILGLE